MAASLGACQHAALRGSSWTPQQHALPRRAAAVRALQPEAPQQQDEARPTPLPLPPPPPAVGWLWDNKKGAADTQRLLKEQNLRPKKSLGQNFMLDDGILGNIVDAAGVQPGDLVLEIGPGTGNLTRHLLAAGALVTAVEKDYALSEQLQAEFEGVPEFRLVVGDVLQQDPAVLLAGMQRHPQQLAAARQAQQAQQAGEAAAEPEGQDTTAEQQEGQQQQQQQQPGVPSQGADGNLGPAAGGRRVKVVANLPYYITKDCLLQWLPLGGHVSSIYFMLQDEVGVRLCQRDPGGADWRVMNLLTQYYSQPSYLFKIDRLKYLPVPKVHGAVVSFELTPPTQRLEVPGEADFIRLIKKAFSQRRKVMRNALRPLWEPADVAAALSAVGLNEDARAQDLTLQEFGKLAWQLQAQEEGRQDGQVAEAAAAGEGQPEGGEAGGEDEQA